MWVRSMQLFGHQCAAEHGGFSSGFAVVHDVSWRCFHAKPISSLAFCLFPPRFSWLVGYSVVNKVMYRFGKLLPHGGVMRPRIRDFLRWCVDFLNLRCSAVHLRHSCALVCCPQFTCGVWTLLRAEMRAVVAGTVEQRPRSSKRCYAPSRGKPISSCSFAPLGMPLCLIV